MTVLPRVYSRHNSFGPRISTAGSLLVFALVCLVAGAPRSAAQQVAPDSTSDASRELIIPEAGILRQGHGQRVLVKNQAGGEQVALLHVEVGDRRLVILPNGRMESRPASQTELTSEPFVAATKEQIVAELKQTGFTRFKTRSTARYVYLYNTSEEFYKGTSRILETMYPAILAYFKRQKLPVHDPNVPLVALMFRTEAEFQKFERVPAGVCAYYSAQSNHIVMYEQSRLVEIAPELATKQAIGTVAHEGIHQILHNIGVQQRLSRWPLWTAEGLAEYFAPTSVGTRLKWKGVGTPNDLRMHELEKFLKQPGDATGEMVEETVTASRLTSAGYASAWALTHYLASRKKEKFHAYLRDVATLEPLDPREGALGSERQKEMFTRHFGSDFAALEVDLIKHMQGLPYTDPVANQTHYVVLLDTTGRRVTGVTSSPAAVRKWQEETLTQLPPAARSQANFQVMAFPNRAAADDFVQQLRSPR
jgi:hypothetical protein